VVIEMNRVERQVDIIKTVALDERRLMERALCDAVEAFSRFAIIDRTPHEAIGLLENWRGVFERQQRSRRF
jgi:hypothetical protein